MGIAQNLQPFTDNEWKIFEWDEKLQTNKSTQDRRGSECLYPTFWRNNYAVYLVLSLKFAIKTLSTYLSLCLCWHDHHVVLSVYVSQHQWLLKYSTMYRLLYTERPTFILFRPPVPSFHFCQGGFHHALFTGVTSSLMKLTFCFYITSFSSLFASSSLHKFTSLFR